MTYRALGAWATAGVALWCSLGVLDVTDGAAGTIRLAMLPGLLQLAGSVALALLLGLLLGLRQQAGAGAADDTVLPLFGLASLILPYLPWLSDWMPVLRMFAGPGKYLVWAIVLSQVLWAALGAGRGRRVAASLHQWPWMRAFLLVLAASLIVSAGASRALAPSGLFPAGDELHYLVGAHSMAADGDLNVADDYRAHTYAAFTARELEPRLERMPDGTAGNRTAMPIGLSVLLAPVFGVAGYNGAVLLLNLIAALTAALVWLWVRRATDSVSAATFAWAATALSMPAVVGSGRISPDTPAGFLLVLAGALVLWPGAVDPHPPLARRPALNTWQALLLGVVAALLPWLHPVYAAVALSLIGIGAWRIARPGGATGRGTVLTALALTVPVLGGLLSLGVFYRGLTVGQWFWLPAAGAAGPTGLAFWGRHLLALVADQQYGVLACAPALGLPAIGLGALWLRRGSARTAAIEFAVISAAIAAPAALYGARLDGAAFPGQFVLPAVLLAAVPLAYEYRRASQRPERRAVYRLLLLMGLGATLASLTVRGGALLALGRDGVSPLIAWLSPDWALSSMAPEFLTQSAWLGLTQALLWLASVAACTALVSWVAARGGPAAATSRIGRGLAFTRANAGALLAVLLATTVMPILLGSRLKPGAEPRDRGRIEMLDSFDPYARPIAVRFDPWSPMDALSVPQAFELSARPIGANASPSGGADLNARFALPAGRYRVRVMTHAARANEGPLSGGVSLQAGTWGGSMIEWSVEGTDSRQWTDTFDLPADMGLVTFATRGPLSQRLRELRVVPYRVVPYLDRIAADDVRAAAAFDRLLFLFHDPHGYPDGAGFWVRGASPARVSVVSRTGRLITDLRLALKSRVANQVRIEMPDRVWTETLEADEEREITVKPTLLDGTIRMVLTPAQGFYPVDTDRGSTDRRYLGCYVRILQ